MFPIKYIENNLVLNNEKECFAYYEMLPYNYSFLSVEQKNQIHDEFRQLVAANKTGRLHFLMIAAESSIAERQERSKRCVKGRHKKAAEYFIDKQTEVLVKDTSQSAVEDGINVQQKNGSQIDYRFFLGIKLVSVNEEMSMKRIRQYVKSVLLDFVKEVNHQFAGDFYSVDNAEMARFVRMEKHLFKRLNRRFRFKPMTEKDFGYLIEHLYGQVAVPYYQYHYKLPKEKLQTETLVKKYDLLKLSRCLCEEHQRYVKLSRQEGTVYAAYLTIDTIISEVAFPSSEMLYYSQEALNYPVDVSINVEVSPNKSALTTVRNKKKEMQDLDNHAYQNNQDTDNTVLDGLQAAVELEDELIATKDAMYKVSYVLRVSADSLEVLEERVDELIELYGDSDIKLVRPFGDMLGLSGEFVPTSKRYINDYVQYVTADFFAGFGFGAAQIIGEEYGQYIGINTTTGRHVYIRPELAAQGVKGSVTNALSKAFLGSLGGGKSMAVNLLATLATVYGAKTLIIDPKSERGRWNTELNPLGLNISIVELSSAEENRGMLDPFVIMRRAKDAESLAMDVLTYLTGVTINDGERFPVLREAVRRVGKSERRGMLYVIEELHAAGNPVAENLARHIEGFSDYDFASLFFSDGSVKKTIGFEGDMNIIQVQDLVLPDKEKSPDEYSSVERLSVAAMIVISSFALDFIYSDRSVFKEVVIDEAWSLLGVAQGKTLVGKLVRAGRSMNAAVDIVTQNTDDVGDEKMKNNIGLKFAFRSTDIVEVKKILTFFGLDPEDEGNQKQIKGLENGECLFQDLYGRTAIIYVDVIFGWLFRAFDTRPPQEPEEEVLPDELLETV